MLNSCQSNPKTKIIKGSDPEKDFSNYLDAETALSSTNIVLK